MISFQYHTNLKMGDVMRFMPCPSAMNIYIPKIKTTIVFHEESPIEIRLPVHMNYEIVDTDPGEKGNTAQGGTKPAKIVTGIVLQVPLFVQIGDTVRVDTREKRYIERIKQ